MPLALAFASAVASAPAEESTASTDSACRRRMQRESAAGGEAIQHAPARPASRRQIIFALIQIHAGLLPVQQIGFELQPVHLDLHPLRNLAGERRPPPAASPSSLRTLASLRARIPAGASSSCRQSDDHIARAIHALVQRLQRQVRARSGRQSTPAANRLRKIPAGKRPSSAPRARDARGPPCSACEKNARSIDLRLCRRAGAA